MKKSTLFLASLVAFALTSCKSLQTYYQICEVNSSLTLTADRTYEYSDEACKITYNFWSEGGNAGFLMTNNADEIIYIDLDKSFFIKNGKAHDYYLNRTFQNSHSYSKTTSTGKSASAYGYWNSLAGLVPGAISSYSNSDKTARSSSSVSIEEKKVVAIPPHSSKFITEYEISSYEFSECEWNMTPRKGRPQTYNFSPVNTPLSFSNYITYRLGENPSEHHVSNDFYISSLTMYCEKDILMEVNVGCPQDKKNRKINIIRNSSPNNFYNIYSRIGRSSSEENNVVKTYEYYW